MKRKRGKKSNRGRKPNRGVLSGIDPERDTFDEIRARIACESAEWPIVALRYLLSRGYSLHDDKAAPFWNRLCVELARAVINDDAEWFKQQAKAFDPAEWKGKTRFYVKTVSLFEQAFCETQAKRKPLTAITLTPAGKSTDWTARDIYNAMEKHEKDGVLVVEGCPFERPERAIDAIVEFAKLLQLALKKQLRKP
jgi:hypothetical protein